METTGLNLISNRMLHGTTLLQQWSDLWCSPGTNLTLGVINIYYLFKKNSIKPTRVTTIIYLAMDTEWNPG